MAPGTGLVGGGHDRHPGAALARELELCYTSLTLVTDLDAGAESGEGVSHEEVLRVFAANVDRRGRPVRRGGSAAGDRGLGTARAGRRWAGWIRDHAAVVAGRCRSGAVPGRLGRWCRIGGGGDSGAGVGAGRELVSGAGTSRSGEGVVHNRWVAHGLRRATARASSWDASRSLVVSSSHVVVTVFRSSRSTVPSPLPPPRPCSRSAPRRRPRARCRTSPRSGCAADVICCTGSYATGGAPWPPGSPSPPRRWSRRARTWAPAHWDSSGHADIRRRTRKRQRRRRAGGTARDS